ncbi:MAG TPA: hypothetical protein DDZ51_09760 [Planctomycetaceae bacterium]|nr:hypothetical protein [Planctomycetaceae bacterium]
MSEPIAPNWHKLVAVERYFVRSQSSDGSPVFSAEADFDGVLDADVLKRAVECVLPLHPLLSSRVEHEQAGLVWKSIQTADVLQHTVVDTLETPSPGCSFLEPPVAISIRSQAGLAVRLFTSANGRSRLRFEYHHACTDGQGGARFYRDVTMTYAAMKSGETKETIVDQIALSRRGHFETPSGETPIGIGEGLRNLWVTIKGRNHRIQPIRQPSNLAPSDSGQKDLVAQFILDSEQARSIHGFLVRSKHVMNDVMTAAGFLMLNQCSSSQPSGEYLNILNPVDLRTWADRRSPASNRVGFAYIRRRSSDWATPGQLLESVAEQLRYVRQRGAAAELMRGVELVEKIPFAVNRIERSGRFTPTVTLTCLSNLQLGRRHGVKLESGQWMLAGAKIDRVACIAPLPPGVPLAITVTGANGQITITMRGRGGHFDADRLKSFGEGFFQSCNDICQ